MLKAIEFNVAGKIVWLAFNCNALIKLAEFCQSDNYAKKLIDNSELVAPAFVILAEQGELFRRYLKYEYQEFISAKDLVFFASPVEKQRLLIAVLEAIFVGYGQELSDDSTSIDLGLLEFEQLHGTVDKNTRLTQFDFMKIALFLGIEFRTLFQYMNPNDIYNLLKFKTGSES